MFIALLYADAAARFGIRSERCELRRRMIEDMTNRPLGYIRAVKNFAGCVQLLTR